MAVQMWYLLLLTTSFVSLRSHGASCPCEKEELCKPITGQKDYEVLVFDVGGTDWKYYDWDMVTTVAIFGKYDPNLMCFAHSKGARVVLKGDVPVSDIVDPKNRTAWITEKVNLAKAQFMDGINIDIEQEVGKNSPEYYALTALVEESTETFHREIPGSQVSFDVAWSPDCIDKRCYDYTAIAKSCDFIFVMSYDEESQIWGDCIAMANAPYIKTLIGYEQYLMLNIDPQKIVMGVPWYGYDYPCLKLSEEGVCSIPKVSFKGAPCSDAAGRQIPYSTIMKQVNNSMTGRLWDPFQLAPYYNYKAEDGTIHQVWYDDPLSISLKTQNVWLLGLRGTGMWNGDLLDYSDNSIAREQTQAMWKVLKPV
ncbi:di-N-acetylchitobiase isoform X1 [Scleropages formosus]|uniref:Di-N-acetylchitobiase n=1 Tax=Scleropages formosus TaxID=113540 RepID=A0A8C9TCQ9_SCLFO|nr:di-N-acetylchitobiase isoform X1 [Scleropages formosus]